jgi:hypothetical protein
MGKAVRYEVLSGNAGADLARKVADYLAKGWELHGAPVSHGGGLHQAMVFTAARPKRIRRTSED